MDGTADRMEVVESQRPAGIEADWSTWRGGPAGEAGEVGAVMWRWDGSSAGRGGGIGDLRGHRGWRACTGRRG